MNYFLNVHQVYDINYALTTGGKLLFLCQEFEYSCKFVIPHLIANTSHSVMTLDKYIDILKENTNLFLGQLKSKSKDLWEKYYNKASYLDIQSAIESRNFICHNFFENMMSEIQGSTHFAEFRKVRKYATQTEALMEYFKQGSPMIQRRIKYKVAKNVILTHAKNLALGNYIISSIHYYIEEKEPFYITKKDYVEAYLRFVLSK